MEKHRTHHWALCCTPEEFPKAPSRSKHLPIFAVHQSMRTSTETTAVRTKRGSPGKRFPYAILRPTWRSAFLVGIGCGVLAALLAGWPGASSQWVASNGASLLGLWDLWFATQQGLGEGLHTQLTRFPEGEVLAPALVGELPIVWLLFLVETRKKPCNANCVDC